MALSVWSYIKPELKRNTERRASPSDHTAPTRGAMLLFEVGNSRDVAIGALAIPSGTP
jgi:hypothetical protein